jgi:hypothetical protein
MFSSALSTKLTVLVLGAALAVAQTPTVTTPTAASGQPTFGATPFAEKRFTWGQIPYKADSDVGLIRGDQYGFNICNSTTENQKSLCQTMLFNSIDDFCLWGPPEYGQPVGNIEGIMVAWCTKPGHGTRLIPEGALTGVQWTKTPGYIQAVGYFDQTKVNLLEGDYGGEMDPHGADLRGNPMGGLIFTTDFGGSVPQQAPQWHNFVGGNKFCLKICDLRDPANYALCENRLDRMGCDYNAPSNAQDGVFEECLGDNQDIPGVYTLANGQTSSFVQPYEGEFTVPYKPKVPASSQCTTHSSAALYSGLPSASTTASSAKATSSGMTKSTSKASGGSGASASATAGANAAGSASTFAVSGAALFGSLLAALYLA